MMCTERGTAGKTPDGSITRGLRLWLGGHRMVLLADSIYDLEKLFDKVDADYDTAVRNACMRGYDAGRDSVADMEPQDPWLAEHGLCKLPVDADGKTWHVGDVADDCDTPGGTVTDIKFGRHGWSLVFDDTAVCGDPSAYRHRRSTPAERIRAAVRALTDEGGADGPALKDLLAVADELEEGLPEVVDGD